MKKVAFYTLGCKLNYSETSTIARMFEAKGYQKVGFEESPDIFIINTCSVTEHADKKCRKVVREAKKVSPEGYVAIIGCYAQLKPREIAEIPGVDAVLGAAEKFRLIELLDGFQKTGSAQVLASGIKEAKAFNSGYSFGDRTRTFLKLQDGCNYGCTFCTIPLARGKSRSGTIEEAVAKAHEIAASEVKEVVLTGVNLGDVGIVDGKRSYHFYELMCALEEVEDIARYRISSIEPNLLTPQVIKRVAAAQKFAPHFHIPLQSGSNKILQLMRRRYLRELYADRVYTIKSVMPHACIGVDVITGFPGETEEDFLETYQFLNGLPISYLHVFTYSERANTPAAVMEGVVPVKVREARTTMLRSLSEKKKRAFYEAQVGKTFEVIFEDDVENGYMHGFTENYVRVKAKYDPLLINELKTVTITGIGADGLAEVEEPALELVHGH